MIVGFFLIRGCASQEEPERYYFSRQDIVSDGIIGRGWVPPWLPSSATAINETHNLDTNEVWMKFKLDPNELMKIEACRRDIATDIKNANGPRFLRRSWWVKPEGNDWDGYMCSWKMDGQAREARMIVSKNKGIAFYWEEH